MASGKFETPTEGLTCYLVGGVVRDKYLNIKKDHDRDWVVVGANEEMMLERGFKRVGSKFPVYLHPESHEEYALARTETKSGQGYKGFDFDASKNVSLEKDLYRRDLTINAMAETLDGKLIDPFNGMSDLQNRVLRHVSEHFSEDPLRVLRVARFAARLHSKEFTISDGTWEFMREIANSGELAHLVHERVWKEVHTVLSDNDPWIFFETLEKCGALEILFPEIKSLLHAATCETQGISIIQQVEAALNQADGMSEIRYAILMHFIGNDQGCDAVKKFGKRLRAPSYFLSLASLICLHGQKALNLSGQSPEEIVKLVRSLDGLRQPRQLEDCIKVWSAVSLSKQKNVRLLEKFRDAMTDVNGKMLATQYQGQKLADKVHQSQIENVKLLMVQYRNAGLI